MSCGCNKAPEDFQAKTVSKRKKKDKKPRQRNFGDKVRVTIKGKTFFAHKKKGKPENIRKLRERNPKLYYRSQATREVAEELKSNGERVDIMSKSFQKKVTDRAEELMRGK